MPSWYADLVCLATFLFALSVRACVGLAGYSGETTPPMYGDFEAQRHWMELTLNLPPRAWYVHGPDNDLLYWGLDYPPLSAHLSWLLGKLARAFGHPELVALHALAGVAAGEVDADAVLPALVVLAVVDVPADLLRTPLRRRQQTKLCT